MVCKPPRRPYLNASRPYRDRALGCFVRGALPGRTLRCATHCGSAEGVMSVMTHERKVSMTRSVAGCVLFFTFTQSFDRPPR